MQRVTLADVKSEGRWICGEGVNSGAAGPDDSFWKAHGDLLGASARCPVNSCLGAKRETDGLGDS